MNSLSFQKIDPSMNSLSFQKIPANNNSNNPSILNLKNLNFDSKYSSNTNTLMNLLSLQKILVVVKMCISLNLTNFILRKFQITFCNII